MPSFLSRLMGAGRSRAAAPPEAKASRASRLLAVGGAPEARWTPREGRSLAEQGFRRNPVAHRCVKLVAEAVAALHWDVCAGGVEDPGHPAAIRLRRPNPHQTGADLIEALTVHLLVFGDAFLEAVCEDADGPPLELHVLRPDRMRPLFGRDGWIEAYDYAVNGRKVTFRQDEAALPPILHLKLFDPLEDHRGFAPLAAAQMALDAHNAATAWNKALIDNAARPSGALVYTAEGGGLSDEQFDRLKTELEANFQGALNAGRPILLEGGLDWKPLSLSPKDMDFLDAKAAAAREIALALGVPPLLLGLQGDNTYANYAEAARSFQRQTVIPLGRRILDRLALWLAPVWPDIRFEIDLDRVDALAEQREAQWRPVLAAGDVLTREERREALGYPKEPAPDGEGR
jgi:HK97 family phage portal protein